MAHTRFANYLRKLQHKHFDSVKEFADALGVDPTHLSRAMGTNSRPFDMNGLLKLADVTGEHPFVILHAAGKGELADELVKHFGKPVAQPEMSAKRREVNRLWVLIERQADTKVAVKLMDFALYLLHSHVERYGLVSRDSGLAKTRNAIAHGNQRPIERRA